MSKIKKSLKSFGFQFGLYHVVVALNVLRGISFAYCLYYYFWLIRYSMDPKYSSSIFVRGLLLLVLGQGDAFWLCFVSVLWGSTNPLIRKGSKGIEEIHRSSRIRQFVAEVIFLASNWKYMIPFLLNQCGSVVFYLTLASVDLSIAVPITNSLTMLITTLAGRILGEGKINAGTFLGIALVISGVTVCVMDKAP